MPTGISTTSATVTDNLIETTAPPVPTMTLDASVGTIVAGSGERGEFTLNRDGELSQDLLAPTRPTVQSVKSRSN
jgi:hypothetical protein